MDIRITLTGHDTTLANMIKATGARLDLTTVDRAVLLATAMSPAPDVLILDAREQPVVLATVAGFKRINPATSVLMVVPRFEAEQLVEAMRAGVTECLADPVTPEELVGAIGRARGRNATKSSGKLFAFVGASGGIGVTTTAVNVAAALSESSPGHVLLIDMDLVAQGAAALLLGSEPRFTVVDALENTHRLDTALLDSLVVTVGGIDLLADGERFAPASIGVTEIRTLLAFAVQAYPLTVVDLSARNGIALDALDPVTTIVVLVNQELTTVRRSVPLVRQLQQRYGKDRVALVLTREDQAADLSRADIERAIGATVLATLPSDYRALQAALNVGRPVVGSASNPLVTAFRSLALTLSGATASIGAESPARSSPRRFWRAK